MKYTIRYSGQFKRSYKELILLLLDTGTHSDLFGKR